MMIFPAFTRENGSMVKLQLPPPDRLWRCASHEASGM
jgi:hypothetical protein